MNTRFGLTVGTVFSFVGMLAGSIAIAQGGSSAVPEKSREQRVDEIFAQYDSTRSPGCSLSVLQGGETIYQRGYGMANLEYNLALTPRSVFRIASTSKQFTAASIALLAEQGKLDLDDDVRKYLPELREHEVPATIRQMLHHTSGIRDYLELMWLAGADDADHYEVEDAFEMIARQRVLNFEPNSEHLYSNAGYFLLSRVVERASGQTLREYARENIFQPLGMADTHFHDDHTEVVKNRADGYAPNDSGGFDISMTTLDMVGDGGVFTTVEDLARWDANFYDNRLGKGGTELIELLLTPGVLNNGEQLSYALGLGVGEYRGLPLVSHGGAFVGFRANLLRFPEERFSVICLCNLGTTSPSRLARQVADVYLADRFEEASPGAASEESSQPIVELPARDLERLTGIYFNEEDRRIARILLKEGQLFYSRGDGDGMPLETLSRNRLRVADRARKIEANFSPENGPPEQMVVTFDGSDPDTYLAVEEADYSAEDLAAFEGTYYCYELDVRYTLRAAEDGLTVEKPGEDFALEAAFADFFTVHEHSCPPLAVVRAFLFVPQLRIGGSPR